MQRHSLDGREVAELKIYKRNKQMSRSRDVIDKMF